MTGDGSVVQSDTLEEDEASDGRALVDVLIEELERLPAQPSVAVRTVWVADQPNSSAKDLAAALTADPALTARVFWAWRFPETFIEAVPDHHARPATLTEPHTLLLVAAEAVASRLVTSPASELEHGPNAGLRALNLDVTDALAIARQVEDDVAQLLHAFSS